MVGIDGQKGIKMKRIRIWAGVSGSGKDYLMRQYLESYYGRNAERIVTYTTRPMRSKEINHIDYHFVTDDEFDVLKLTGKLIEQRNYHVADGSIWKYGTGYFVNEWCDEYCGVFDLTGIEAIIKAYPDAEVVVNYVYCPADIRRKRAEKRDANFNLAEWERRLKADEEDFSEEKLAHLNDVLRQYGNPPIQYVNNY
jgi:guanylate kinase